MKSTLRTALCFAFFSVVAVVANGQSQSDNPPEANPARPTVSTPATLTPVGYLQFETGYLAAWHSPGFSSQLSFNEVLKVSLSPSIELLALSQPLGITSVSNQTSVSAGGVWVGAQGVVHHGEGARPTISMSYLRQVYGGNVPDLDIGSPTNSVTLLFSADIKKFHYDTNYLFNEVTQDNIRRAQFGQTLSVSHPLTGRFGLTGEIWHFSQPFLQSNAVGTLWAATYNARKNLVFDTGFNRGLTSTSTRWIFFGGFTYLLPHRLWRH